MNSYEIASGDNVYLDYIFNAKSYADLVYRYSLVQQIVKYNDEQIDSWSSKIEYNNQLQKDLAAKEIELNQKISQLNVDIDSLGDKLSEYTDIVMDAQDEIDSTQELINYYVSLGCGENEDLDACVSIKGDTKFRKPLVKGTITSYYGYRIHPIYGYTKFHSGIDIGGNKEGTPIYASANGMVGKIIRRASCGGNQVYVYHTINGKQYTTLYMHLLSINVSIGDKVTSQSVVGTVGGGYGTSSYEQCSTGAHLHFTIATGWYGKTYVSYSTFLANTVDPKNILGLPSMYTYWYSR
jgi:murein DD-endopeptidase MepM/ murein hydrolase activator NlpD